MSVSLGVDIGGTTVKAAALRDGSILWTSRSRPYARPGRAELIAAVREALGRLQDRPDHVGLCVPGILGEGRRYVALAPNMPGLEGLAFSDLLEPAALPTGVEPVVINDAEATAQDIFAEHRLSGRLLVLALGTGVGLAVLDDGRALRVEGESAGHIGQIDVSVEGAPVIGPDGGQGGLEGYIGAAALRAAYGPDAPSKIAATDPAAKALVRTVRICHAIYRPHHVCLAGGVGIRLAHLLPDLRRMIDTHLSAVARPDWTLFCATGDFHAALGAARAASGAI